MYSVLDRQKGFAPVKSGFKTSAQANHWCKKNLRAADVRLWGEKSSLFDIRRYFVVMR